MYRIMKNICDREIYENMPDAIWLQKDEQIGAFVRGDSVNDSPNKNQLMYCYFNLYSFVQLSPDF
jgi:hypothetical protein